MLITRIGKGYAQAGWFSDRRIGASERRAVVCQYQPDDLTKSRAANEDRRMDATARRLTDKAAGRPVARRTTDSATYGQPADRTRHAGANAVCRSRDYES